MHSPPLWLKNINEPVHAADLCQFLWQLHRREISPATPIFDSHRRITLWNHELFRIKCPFYDPFIPSHRSLSPSLSPLPSFLLSHPLFLSLSLPAPLFPSQFLAHLPYLGWLHHNGHQAPGTTPSLPNLDRTKKYIVRQPPKRGSYRAVSCFRRRGCNVTFLVCRNAHLIPRNCPTANFEIFYNYW